MSYQCIDLERAEALIAGGETLILDARDECSFARSHIDRARRISSTNIDAIIHATARTTAVLIYCYHGHASREYAQTFSDFGYLDVFSLDGGYEAWQGGRTPTE